MIQGNDPTLVDNTDVVEDSTYRNTPQDTPQFKRRVSLLEILPKQQITTVPDVTITDVLQSLPPQNF